MKTIQNMQLADFYLLQCFCCNWYSELWLFSNYVKFINLNIFNPGLGSSTVDQVLKYTKYPKHLPSTSTGQVLILKKKYLSTSSTFKSSTSTHIKIGSKVGMDIQSKFWMDKTKGLSPNHVLAQKSI